MKFHSDMTFLELSFPRPTYISVSTPIVSDLISVKYIIPKKRHPKVPFLAVPIRLSARIVPLEFDGVWGVLEIIDLFPLELRKRLDLIPCEDVAG